MPNIGKRNGDFKKKKDVKQLTYFHNPNDGIMHADPVQQFDILSGVEKEKKVRPKDVFENYHNNTNKRKVNKENQKHRSVKMVENQVRGKKRGIDKKNPKK
jgi:hypothetical protein